MKNKFAGQKNGKISTSWGSKAENFGKCGAYKNFKVCEKKFERQAPKLLLPDFFWKFLIFRIPSKDFLEIFYLWVSSKNFGLLNNLPPSCCPRRSCSNDELKWENFSRNFQKFSHHRLDLLGPSLQDPQGIRGGEQWYSYCAPMAFFYGCPQGDYKNSGGKFPKNRENFQFFASKKIS